MIRELKNWTEITNGIYQYVVDNSICYEIHILYHYMDTDILTANASLYLVGNWSKPQSCTTLFERELLLNNSVMECLEEAAKDERRCKHD